MRIPETIGLLLGLFLCGCAPAPPAPMSNVTAIPLAERHASLDEEAAARGAAIAYGVCGSCHSAGRGATSALAAAPAFSDIVGRRSLDDIESAMAQGLLTTHPAMPAFVFRASEIDDFVAYLSTLRQDGPGR